MILETPADRKCGRCGKVNRHRTGCALTPSPATTAAESSHKTRTGYVLKIRVAYYAWYFCSVFDSELEATRYARLNYPGKEFNIEFGVHP